MSHEVQITNLEFGMRGKFRAVVHTGHKYDDEGNIVEYGEVLRETPFGRNLILNGGFDWWLTGTLAGGGSIQYLICGPSNVAPVPGDTNMPDAFGYAATFVSSTQVASNADPGMGPLFCTVQHRRTFLPGSLGASPVNVSKAGIACGAVGNPTLTQLRAQPMLAAGLLVDGSGSPTSIAVNPNEYLDLIWEHTEYYPHDVAGSFTLTTDDVPLSLIHI